VWPCGSGPGDDASEQKQPSKQKKLSDGSLNHWKRRDQLMIAVGDAILRIRAVQQEYEKKSDCRGIEVAAWRKPKNIELFFFSFLLSFFKGRY